MQQQKSALSQEQGQIATAGPAAAAGRGRRRRPGRRSAKQQRRRSAAAAAAPAAGPRAARHASLAGLSQAAPPPTAAGGAGAVQAAESQIGVPYVWGGESPKGSGQPRLRLLGPDRLVLGPGRRRPAALLGRPDGGLDAGAHQRPPAGRPPLLRAGWLRARRHVRRPGPMIEAPYTGASVWITALRLGGDFVGAGRP